MINIKKFIDRVSMVEGRQGKDVVISINDARGLRDELAKLLADQYQVNTEKSEIEPVIKIDVKGGSFK